MLSGGIVTPVQDGLPGGRGAVAGVRLPSLLQGGLGGGLTGRGGGDRLRCLQRQLLSAADAGERQLLGRQVSSAGGDNHMTVVSTTIPPQWRPAEQAVLPLAAQHLTAPSGVAAPINTDQGRSNVPRAVGKQPAQHDASDTAAGCWHHAVNGDGPPVYCDGSAVSQTWRVALAAAVWPVERAADAAATAVNRHTVVDWLAFPCAAPASSNAPSAATARG
jgi:hypothetical protein